MQGLARGGIGAGGVCGVVCVSMCVWVCVGVCVCVCVCVSFRPYTPMRGALSNVWFDRHQISRDCSEHLESVDDMCSTLGSILHDEVQAGIPKHRIIIGRNSHTHTHTHTQREREPWCDFMTTFVFAPCKNVHTFIPSLCLILVFFTHPSISLSSVIYIQFTKQLSCTH